MTILINCAGKFCYRYGNFQNTEAATESFLKKITKCTGRPGALLKKRLQHKFVCVNFVKYFRTTFLQRTVSQNMKAYLWQWPTADVKLFWKYLENIQEHICIGAYLRYVTSSVKLKIGWVHITIKIRYHKTSKISLRACISGELIPWVEK